MKIYEINCTDGSHFGTATFEKTYLKHLTEHFKISKESDPTYFAKKNYKYKIKISSLKKLSLLESLCEQLSGSNNDFAQGIILKGGTIEIYDDYRE